MIVMPGAKSHERLARMTPKPFSHGILASL
jgi:hypothetical protein